MAHSLLVVIYHMLRGGAQYADLRADYFAKRNAEAAKRRSIRELKRRGYKMTLAPIDACLGGNCLVIF